MRLRVYKEKQHFFYTRPIKYRKSCTDFNLKTYEASLKEFYIY